MLCNHFKTLLLVGNKLLALLFSTEIYELSWSQLLTKAWLLEFTNYKKMSKILNTRKTDTGHNWSKNNFKKIFNIL